MIATREATICASSQYLPSISWNQKFHYRVRKSSPPVPILSQTNPVRTTSSYLYKINLSEILLQMDMM
jgi:hypothetical protein